MLWTIKEGLKVLNLRIFMLVGFFNLCDLCDDKNCMSRCSFTVNYTAPPFACHYTQGSTACKTELLLDMIFFCLFQATDILAFVTNWASLRIWPLYLYISRSKITFQMHSQVSAYLRLNDAQYCINQGTLTHCQVLS